MSRPTIDFSAWTRCKCHFGFGCSQLWQAEIHSLSPSVTWRKTNWGLDIVSQISNKDLTKIADPALIFVKRSHLIHYTDTSYCIHPLWEICPSLFIGPPCIVLNFYIVIRAYGCFCGSVDQTTDSQPWYLWFESTGSSISALGQGLVHQKAICILAAYKQHVL